MQPIGKRSYSGGCKESGCCLSIEGHYVAAAWKPRDGLNLHRGFNPRGAFLAARQIKFTPCSCGELKAVLASVNLQKPQFWMILTPSKHKLIHL